MSSNEMIAKLSRMKLKEMGQNILDAIQDLITPPVKEQIPQEQAIFESNPSLDLHESPQRTTHALPPAAKGEALVLSERSHAPLHIEALDQGLKLVENTQAFINMFEISSFAPEALYHEGFLDPIKALSSILITEDYIEAKFPTAYDQYFMFDQLPAAPLNAELHQAHFDFDLLDLDIDWDAIGDLGLDDDAHLNGEQPADEQQEDQQFDQDAQSEDTDLDENDFSDASSHDSDEASDVEYDDDLIDADINGEDLPEHIVQDHGQPDAAQLPTTVHGEVDNAPLPARNLIGNLFGGFAQTIFPWGRRPNPAVNNLDANDSDPDTSSEESNNDLHAGLFEGDGAFEFVEQQVDSDRLVDASSLASSSALPLQTQANANQLSISDDAELGSIVLSPVPSKQEEKQIDASHVQMDFGLLSNEEGFDDDKDEDLNADLLSSVDKDAAVDPDTSSQESDHEDDIDLDPEAVAAFELILQQLIENEDHDNLAKLESLLARTDANTPADLSLFLKDIIEQYDMQAEEEVDAAQYENDDELDALPQGFFEEKKIDSQSSGSSSAQAKEKPISVDIDGEIEHERVQLKPVQAADHSLAQSSGLEIVKLKPVQVSAKPLVDSANPETVSLRPVEQKSAEVDADVSHVQMDFGLLSDEEVLDEDKDLNAELLSSVDKDALVVPDMLVDSDTSSQESDVNEFTNTDQHENDDELDVLLQGFFEEQQVDSGSSSAQAKEKPISLDIDGEIEKEIVQLRPVQMVEPIAQSSGLESVKLKPVQVAEKPAAQSSELESVKLKPVQAASKPAAQSSDAEGVKLKPAQVSAKSISTPVNPEQVKLKPVEQKSAEKVNDSSSAWMDFDLLSDDDATDSQVDTSHAAFDFSLLDSDDMTPKDDANQHSNVGFDFGLLDDLLGEDSSSSHASSEPISYHKIDSALAEKIAAHTALPVHTMIFSPVDESFSFDTEAFLQDPYALAKAEETYLTGCLAADEAIFRHNSLDLMKDVIALSSARDQIVRFLISEKSTMAHDEAKKVEGLIQDWNKLPIRQVQESLDGDIIGIYPQGAKNAYAELITQADMLSERTQAYFDANSPDSSSKLQFAASDSPLLDVNGLMNHMATLVKPMIENAAHYKQLVTEKIHLGAVLDMTVGDIVGVFTGNGSSSNKQNASAHIDIPGISQADKSILKSAESKYQIKAGQFAECQAKQKSAEKSVIGIKDSYDEQLKILYAKLEANKPHEKPQSWLDLFKEVLKHPGKLAYELLNKEVYVDQKMAETAKLKSFLEKAQAEYKYAQVELDKTVKTAAEKLHVDNKLNIVLLTLEHKLDSEHTSYTDKQQYRAYYDAIAEHVGHVAVWADVSDEISNALLLLNEYYHKLGDLLQANTNLAVAYGEYKAAESELSHLKDHLVEQYADHDIQDDSSSASSKADKSYYDTLTTHKSASEKQPALKEAVDSHPTEPPAQKGFLSGVKSWFSFGSDSASNAVKDAEVTDAEHNSSGVSSDANHIDASTVVVHTSVDPLHGVDQFAAHNEGGF